jgi:hypothetical protein
LIELSTLLDAISKVRVGIWQFVRLVLSANHDYPYHDYFEFENEGEDDVDVPYVVGSNNVDAHGTQRKLFTAKRTLLWSRYPIDFRLNSANNVLIEMKRHQEVLEDRLYQMELHTNISIIIFKVPGGCTINAYFEGVFPDEARNPE